MKAIKRQLLSIYGILIITPLIVAQVPSIGKCPTNLITVANLNVNKLMGLWYEAEKYPLVFEAGNKCITSMFEFSETYKISIKTRQTNRFTSNDNGYTGYASIVAPGHFTLEFPGLPFQLSVETQYFVLDTDYKEYAVTFACRDMAGLMSGKMVWILTRKAQPGAAILEKAYAALDRNKISKSYLIHTDQVNC